MGRRKLIEDDQLLAQVREIFVREGVNVSSRRIAEEIGISDSVLFQRFGSKENLLFAAMTPPSPDMGALLEDKGSRGHARTHLEQIATRLLEYFREFVPILAPLANHPSFDYGEFRARHPDSPLEKLMHELAIALEKKRDRGEIDCPDIGALILNLVAVAYSMAMFERIGVHNGEFSQAMVKQLARLVWRGVAPAEERAAGQESKKKEPRRAGMRRG